MKKCKTTLIILGALGLVFSLAIAPLSTSAGAPFKEPCVSFTVKGVDIPGSENCNSAATDVWVVFRGHGSMTFSTDGNPIDPSTPTPKGTNDFHVMWVKGTCEFLDPPGLVWTKNGAFVTSTPIPADSIGPVNDFEFEAKKIAKVMWSFGPGTIPLDVPIPKGHVTDVHFECFIPGGP